MLAPIPDLTTVEGSSLAYHQKLDLDLRDIIKHFCKVVARMPKPGPRPPKWAAEVKHLRWEKADANFGTETFRMFFAAYDKWVHLQEHAVIVMAMHQDGRRWVEQAKRAKPEYLKQFAALFINVLGRERACGMFEQARNLAIRPGGNYQAEPVDIGGVPVPL